MKRTPIKALHPHLDDPQDYIKYVIPTHHISRKSIFNTLVYTSYNSLHMATLRLTYVKYERDFPYTLSNPT